VSRKVVRKKVRTVRVDIEGTGSAIERKAGSRIALTNEIDRVAV
jgi:hypothetical protein